MNRLENALSKEKTTTWATPAHTAYKEGNISYDLNGNIAHLERHTNASIIMDNLGYTYVGNQLQKVDDIGNDTAGFKDGTNTGNDYGYDVVGNMTEDKNKGITDITYNHLNLPDSVILSDGRYVRFQYDANGTKLSELTYNSSHVLENRLDYSGEFFYKNDTLAHVQHEEGRVMLAEGTPEYQYFYKDIWGNVRTTFTALAGSETNTATLETANTTSEQGEFLYYNEAVKINSPFFDHTNAGSTYYSVRLDGSPEERIGLTKSLSVMPGDTIRAEVYAKYLDTNNNNWTTALNNLVAAIIGGTAPVGTFVDGGQAGSTGGETPGFASLLDKDSETGSAPKAYLNYLIFDEDFVLLNGGFVPLSENAREYGQDGAHEKLEAEFVITQPGFVYIYLSNDNAALSGTSVEVYFDDLNITQIKSPILQEDFYYPFGAIAKTTIQESLPTNKFLYQGKEWIDDLGVNEYDNEWRRYDPWRMLTTTPDPHGESYYNWSSYSWTFNNPISIIDPDGRDGVATIDKDKKTVLVNQTFHYSKSNAEVLTKVLSNLAEGRMTVDEFMVDFNNNWGSETSNVEIDGEKYSVGYSATFVAHDNDEARDKAVSEDLTSNSLIFDRDLSAAGRWSGKDRSITLNPLKVRPDNTTFSHEVAHSFGILGHDPNTPLDEHGNELSGGISSYAAKRAVTADERKATIHDAVILSKSVKDASVKVHLKGYWSKDVKRKPTIIK